MSSTSLQLVAGLGNPGPQYQHTRHNAGFWLVELLARKYGGLFRAENKFKGEVCRISISSHPLWLLKPQTFMNNSGEAVATLARFYKFTPAEILIAHDELDLPVGTVRLKRGGGHGGNNGLRDIIRHLGDSSFLRLRLGIGRPNSGDQAINHVLRRAPQAEQVLLEEAIDDAVREFPRIATGDLEKAMTALHSRKPANTV